MKSIFFSLTTSNHDFRRGGGLLQLSDRFKILVCIPFMSICRSKVLVYRYNLHIYIDTGPVGPFTFTGYNIHTPPRALALRSQIPRSIERHHWQSILPLHDHPSNACGLKRFPPCRSFDQDHRPQIRQIDHRHVLFTIHIHLRTLGRAVGAWSRLGCRPLSSLRNEVSLPVSNIRSDRLWSPSWKLNGVKMTSGRSKWPIDTHSWQFPQPCPAGCLSLISVNYSLSPVMSLFLPRSSAHAHD